MTEPTIIVIRNANVDITTYVPTPGTRATVLRTDFSVGMGGKGLNQAVAASRARGHVASVWRIGTDAFGEVRLHTLGKEELDRTSMNQATGPSGIGTIWVEESGPYCSLCRHIRTSDGHRSHPPLCQFWPSAHLRQAAGNTPS